jgi:2-methylisocitrate lyase-like PEP mutase family enzyme
MSIGSKLQRLIAREPFIAADCYSALTALIVQEVGFPAAYMGGHSTGMMHYAIPDNGVLTPTEMVDQAARVTEAVDIPVIVDADQAGETIADVYRSIRLYGRVGVAGVHIEDEIPPKHSAWLGPLLPIGDMQARIGAAIEGRVDEDFLIIARCDELYSVGGGGGGSLDEAVRRGVAYAAAGADAYLPTMATPEQVAAIAAEVPIPVAGFGSLVPGLAFALSTGWGTPTAARLHWQLATELKETGQLPAGVGDFPDKPGLTRQTQYDRLIESWAKTTARPLRPSTPS